MDWANFKSLNDRIKKLEEENEKIRKELKINIYGYELLFLIAKKIDC